MAAALFAAYTVVLVRTAWLCDDAYFTLRTVDNFVNGFGLRWNIAERVQAYTHPLWLMLLAACYSLTREAYYTVLVLSIAVSCGAFLVATHTAHPGRAALVGASLLFSKAFVDYSTSGLEGPLAHLLLACFLWVLLELEPSSRRRLFGLTTLASLAVLNRLDALLLVGPPVALEIWRAPRTKATALTLLVAAAPLVLWEAFSLLYYGFMLPNTVYAKLTHGLPRLEMMCQGVRYFDQSLRVDPATLSIIGLALALAVRSREPILLAGGIGLLLHLAYVLKVGGDFMSGRFFAAPLVYAAMLLARLLGAQALLPATAVYAVLGLLLTPHPTVLSGAGKDTFERIEYGIADERTAYYVETGLLFKGDGEDRPNHLWVREGRAARRARQTPVVIQSSAGMWGFFAGPQVHLIDRMGLGDPLLSRLPTRDPSSWRIGHYKRVVPVGYLASVRTGDNHIRDPALSAYYERIRSLTRGPLFDRRRLAEVVRLGVLELGFGAPVQARASPTGQLTPVPPIPQ